MVKLYELSETYQKLLDTDELTEEELQTCLNNIQGLFDEKATNIGKLILSLQADGNSIGGEVKRLGERGLAILNRIKGLKFYLAQEMEATKTDKVKDELLTITLQKSPPSVQLDNEELIHKDYWKVIPETRQLDKQAILNIYKSGQEVLGVTIISDKKHVVIR